MGKFIITEEEKRNILNQYKKFKLDEQEQTTTTTTLQPVQTTQASNQNVNLSNRSLGTIKTTGLQLVPNLTGQKVTDKMGTNYQQPMTVQGQTEYQRSDSDSQSDYDNAVKMAQDAQKLSSEENISYDEAYDRIKKGTTVQPQNTTTPQQGTVTQNTTTPQQGTVAQNTATQGTEQKIDNKSVVNRSIEDLQKLITSKGINVGKSDGVLGKNTLSGIENLLNKSKPT
jgi:hypothetical protein